MALCVMPFYVLALCVMPLCVLALCVMPICVLPFSVVFFFTNFDSVYFRFDLTLFTFRLLNFVIDIPS